VLSTTKINSEIIPTAFVLHGHTAQRAVCFNHIGAGRDGRVRGIHDAMGPFFNLLLAKVSFGENDASLENVLRATYQDSLSRMPHEGLSLPAVWERSGRDSNEMLALCDSVVNVHKFVAPKSQEKEGNGVVIRHIGQQGQAAHAITLEVFEKNEGLEVTLGFRAHDVDEVQARRLQASLCETIKALVYEPRKRVKDLEQLLNPGSPKSGGFDH